MANEYRVRASGVQGTITNNPLLVGATTMNGAGLADLPAIGATQFAAITLDPLGTAGAPEVVVLHCFSGDADFARAAAERGWFCSFAGVVTFANAAGLREALEVVPSDLLLVETDAPFLTPVPHRGKPNSSYLLPWTVRAVAAVRDWDLTDTCELLMMNTERAFGPL